MHEGKRQEKQGGYERMLDTNQGERLKALKDVAVALCQLRYACGATYPGIFWIEEKQLLTTLGSLLHLF